MENIEMPTVLKVESLLNSVKQLSPVELDEFTQKLAEWQQHRENSVGGDFNPKASDEEVLAFIQNNSQLPKKENRRYWELRCKHQEQTLNDDETTEYEDFIKQLEVMNVKRLEALAILVQRWGKPVKEIMVELGLFISHLDVPHFSESSQECYPENSK